MTKLVSAALLAMLVGQEGRKAPERPRGDSVLYFFFGEDSRGGDELARRVVPFILEKKGAILLRPVLLASDFAKLGRVKDESPIVRTLKELSKLGAKELDIPIYDLEGLSLAEAWKVNRLPALVLVQGGKAHKASGARVRPESLLECNR